MAKVFIARDTKTKKFIKNSQSYSQTNRPTYYKNAGALYNSMRSPIPQAIRDLVKIERPELFPEGNEDKFYRWHDRRKAFAKHIKNNKLKSSDLLAMLQHEGKIEVFEVDEDKMLDDYMQTTYKIQL